MKMLEVKDLQAGYAGHTIFTHLNLAIEASKITTIIGPNGCGKSTLLKAIGRIIKPQQGEVLLSGVPIATMDTRDVAKRMALLPQNPVTPSGMTVEELVSYGRFPHQIRINQQTQVDRHAIKEALELTGTYVFRHRDVVQLSGGERQRVWLAMVLAQETEVILLDEPTTYLDMVHQLEVLKTIQRFNQERQCSIVMVLHDINQAARFSHEIIAMKQGEIIASGPPVAVIQADVLRKVFQIEAKVIVDAQTGIPVCYSYDHVEAS